MNTNIIFVNNIISSIYMFVVTIPENSNKQSDHEIDLTTENTNVYHLPGNMIPSHTQVTLQYVTDLFSQQCTSFGYR